MVSLARSLSVLLFSIGIFSAQTQAATWELGEDNVPFFYYDPVYADYNCEPSELYISLPQKFNIQFSDNIDVSFGAEIVTLQVLEADTYKDDDGLLLQELVLTGKDLTSYMVDANYYMMLPDKRSGVGIPLDGFQDVLSQACKN